MLQGKLFLASSGSWRLPAFLGWWLHHSNICFYYHIAFSSSIVKSLSAPLLYKDSWITLGPPRYRRIISPSRVHLHPFCHVSFTIQYSHRFQGSGPGYDQGPLGRQIQAAWYPHDLSVMSYLDHLVKVVFARIFHCKVIILNYHKYDHAHT